MTKTLNIEKSFNETTENYEKFSIFFKECGECFCNIMNSTDKAKTFALFSPEENISGFTGTLSSAIRQADLVFTNIDESFKNYGKQLKLSDVFGHILNDRKAYKEESGMLSNKYREIKSGLINDSAVLYVNVCGLIKKLNETYRDYSSSSSTSSNNDNLIQPQSSHGSILQSMNKMVVSNKMTKLYAQYMHNVSDYISFREKIKLCNQEITQYNHDHHTNLNKIDDTLFQNFLTIILPKLCKNISQLGQEFIEQANLLQSKINKIDFEYDFKDYVYNSDLTFKDIIAPRFEPYKFTSPFASPDQIYIQKHHMNYFPVGVAVPISDFQPETQNEVPLIKGKSVYLMEKEPRKGWILVMTLPLAQIGFAPISFLKILTDNITLSKDQIFIRRK